jgi:hypothetical protein
MIRAGCADTYKSGSMRGGGGGSRFLLDVVFMLRVSVPGIE